jgi:hypothetical protein
VTCFDNDLWSDFQFWKDDRCDISDTSNFNFKKWKSDTISYDTVFEGSEFTITIALSSLKQIHIVKVYKVFGLLEDIGGFLGALEMILPIIGGYFSSKLFRADFVKNNFKQKLNGGQNLRTDFKKIKMPCLQALLSPII